MAQHENNKANTVEWLTPKYILDALPTFDLDPCAHARQPYATARRLIVLPEDGLAVTWEGSVWLNPPYGHKEIAPWLEKLARHNDGVALVFARTETRWFHSWIWPFASGLFFFRGRLSFVHAHAVNYRASCAANAAAPSVMVSYGARCRQWLRETRLDGAFVDLNVSGDGGLTAPPKSLRIPPPSEDGRSPARS